MGKSLSKGKTEQPVERPAKQPVERAAEQPASKPNTQNEIHPDLNQHPFDDSTNEYSNLLKCRICDKDFRTKEDLQNHLLLDQEHLQLELKCQICDKVFKRKENLRNHLVTHDKNRSKLKCLDCGKFFSKKGNLKSHCLLVHSSNVENISTTAEWEQPQCENTPENKPECDYCGKKFSRLDNLAVHMKKHLPEKITLSCPQCHKSFSNTSNLKRHLKKAHGENAMKTNIVQRIDYNKKEKAKVVYRNTSPSSQIKIRKSYMIESPNSCSEVQEDVALQTPLCSVEDAADIIETLQADDQIQKSSNGYTPIRNNVYTANITRTDIPLCFCNPTDHCGESCMNKMMAYECTEKCVCGENCTNSPIRKGNFVSVEIMPAHEKGGLGVKSNVEIGKGTFIMEYVGEVIEKSVYEERLKTIYSDDKHTYGVALCDKFIVDAHRVGNICRYVNHSCDPNCQLDRWIVDGLPHLGLFAKRNIKKGEEFTFKYKLHLYNSATNVTCRCGSEYCQGWLAIERKRPHFVMNFKPGRSCQEDHETKQEPKPKGRKIVGVEIGGEVEKSNSRRSELKNYKIPKRKHTQQVSHTEPVPSKRAKFTNTCFDSSGEYNVLPLSKPSQKRYPRQAKDIKIQVEERVATGIETFENETNEGITLGIRNFEVRETTRKAYDAGQTLYSSRNVQLSSNVEVQHIPLPGSLDAYLEHFRSNCEKNEEIHPIVT